MDARDKRQLTDLVAGVTRWRRWLDFVIEQFARRPVDKLDSPVRQMLRLGVYEMTVRSRPVHAVVNEYVTLAGRLARPQAKGFINAVLRRVSEHKDELPEPQMADPAQRLGIRFSHPTWMVRRWLARYGDEATRTILAWNNKRPVFGVRVNTLRTDRAAVESQLTDRTVDWSASAVLDDFLRVESVQPLLQSGLLLDGLVHVQDESAGLVVRVLDPQPDETVVDACAAPGGKTLYACTRMADRGRILALDANAARLRLAEKSAVAAGCSIVQFVTGDATAPQPALAGVQADRVLLDAPCTGLGVLSKRPDLRWRRSEADLAALAELQDNLLDSVSALVRPGGLLVYSTCTIEPEENDDRVDAFLRRHDNFEVESAAPFVPTAMLTSRGFFASLPHRDGMDGAFAARLRRLH